MSSIGCLNKYSVDDRFLELAGMCFRQSMTGIWKKKKFLFWCSNHIKIVTCDPSISLMIIFTGKKIHRTVDGRQTFKKIDVAGPGPDVKPCYSPTFNKTFSKNETDEFLSIMLI